MVAIVTGATAGFGLEITRQFVAQGKKVIAIGRRAERLHALAAELGPAVHPLALDLRDTDAIAALPDSLPEEFSKITILVNNAGLALGLEKAQDAHWNDWKTMIDTNITALVAITRAFLPGMIDRQVGHIVNIGSVAGTYPYAGGNVYGATKAFVKQFSLNLRADVFGTPLRVTNIEPGLVGGTEFSQVRFHGDEKLAASRYEGVTALDAKDVAEAVSWVVNLPAHVNINRLELMPVAQSFSALSIDKK
ncbi:SDR family NAD(P)-dependent oxidoreductase [Bordetella tumulicola]|uniref:SDR family NAD(P)-dependent oxidoreductase n=1 Tax=Bordetella tumulicola TaxID=1649133 RepID=UPI0039F104E2